jgi:DUF1365 family protein
MRVSRFAGYNQWNWTSYEARDHCDARLSARAAGSRCETQWPDSAAWSDFSTDAPALFERSVQPVSFYYCYDRVENFELIMADVNCILLREAQLLARRI